MECLRLHLLQCFRLLLPNYLPRDAYIMFSAAHE